MKKDRMNKDRVLGFLAGLFVCFMVALLSQCVHSVEAVSGGNISCRAIKYDVEALSGHFELRSNVLTGEDLNGDWSCNCTGLELACTITSTYTASN